MTELILNNECLLSNSNFKLAESKKFKDVHAFLQSKQATYIQSEELLTTLLQPVKDCNEEISLLSSISFFNMLNNIFNNSICFIPTYKNLDKNSCFMFNIVKTIYQDFCTNFANLGDVALNITRSSRELKLIEMLFVLYAFPNNKKFLMPKIKGVEAYADDDWQFVFDCSEVSRESYDDFYNRLVIYSADIGIVEKLENKIVINLNPYAVPELDIAARINWDNFFNE